MSTARCIVCWQGLDYGRPRIKLPFGLIFFLACIFEYLVGRSVTMEATSEMALAPHIRVNAVVPTLELFLVVVF